MTAAPLAYILDSTFEAVRAAMDLRPPQRESLRVVHRLIRALPQPIAHLAAEDIVRRVGEEDIGNWHFRDGYVDLTFALATGIGKTRLMGAIMAYLYQSGQSRNFVLLAPRDAILRKLEEESREASSKYIFVNRGNVAQPNVCHRGNLAEYDPRADRELLFAMGPNVFILSPQLLSTGDRIAKTSELVGVSILEYLREAKDLVVLVDESHHISASDSEIDTGSWKSALAGLKPKLVCSMTATPRSGANIGYAYTLGKALQEGRYTKSIRMIVDSRAAAFSLDEYDSFCLKYAISRLQVKEKAIAELRKTLDAFPKINPILLVCAADTGHADKVGKWLVESGGLATDEVLIIHSKKKSEEDLKKLAELESPTSRIRAVVQVHVLDEGWDVTNVYVIAPLRNVKSYVNGRQVMGRGLRLPLGSRVLNTEVDTLDVLAFGQETFQEIYAQASKEFGDPNGNEGILVSEVGALLDPQRTTVVDTDDDERPDTKRVQFEVIRKGKIALPLLEMIPPEPTLRLPESTTFAEQGWRTGIRLGSQTTEAVSGDVALHREAFVAAVVEHVIQEFSVLSAPLHGARLARMVEALLDKAGFANDGNVPLDVILSAKLILRELQKLYFGNVPAYRSIAKLATLDVLPYNCIVPAAFSAPPDQGAITVWMKSIHHRIPITGWNRCAHRAAHFDSKPEFEMAQCIDKMEGVKIWLRNDPAQLTLPTLAGGYGPDFVLWVETATGTKIVLLEVKGEHLWEASTSEARVKARDALIWANAANDTIGKDVFEYSLILGGDVSACTTLEDIRNNNSAGDPEGGAS